MFNLVDMLLNSNSEEISSGNTYEIEHIILPNLFYKNPKEFIKDIKRKRIDFFRKFYEGIKQKLKDGDVVVNSYESGDKETLIIRLPFPEKEKDWKLTQVPYFGVSINKGTVSNQNPRFFCLEYDTFASKLFSRPTFMICGYKNGNERFNTGQTVGDEENKMESALKVLLGIME